MKPRSVTELVRAAQEAFEVANTAQEKGERDVALEQYLRMLDLLKEADLDPIVYHNLRNEFQRILDANAKPAEEGAAEPAHEALGLANAAQEKGDHEAALRQYNRMIEVLAKTNPNPDAFYKVREEFQRILKTGEKQAAKYEKRRMAPPAEELSKDIMAELQTKSPISDRVLTEIGEIQNLYPHNFQGGLDRSSKYLPHIQAEFVRAGLPRDLAWLVMVESQFSPKVVSRAGAAGMWHFMRSTGSRYGMRCDRYVDDRMNWRKATQGAIRYLSDLNERFDGSWPLAVSAYNMGEGGLDRAIAATGNERNLWKLLDTPPASEMMMMETKKFYARLLASIIVAKDPERFGFKSNPQPAEETISVSVRGTYSLAALEQACGMPDGTLRALNPDLIRGVTPPHTEHALNVPPTAQTLLAAALQSVPEINQDVLRSWDRKHIHVVQRGETVDVIAKKYGVSTNDLCKINRIAVASRLTPGRKLTVPIDEFDLVEDHSAGVSPTPNVGAKSKPEPKTAGGKSNNKGQFKRETEQVYTVKKGDTLSDIATQHKVSLADIVAWNKIKKAETIAEGDKLVLKGIEDLPEEPPDEVDTQHVVRTGESLAKIAKLYGVKIDEIAQWNNITKISKVNVGDKLVIKGAAKEENVATPPIKGEAAEKKTEPGKQPKGTKKLVHTVAKGETATSIAAKYNVAVSELLAWNNLTSNSIVRAGDEHIVYVADNEKKAVPKKDDSKKSAPAKKEESAMAVPKKDDSKKPAPAKKEESAKAVPKKDDSTKPAPAKKEESAKAAKPSKIVHTVAKGESATGIAARYKVKVSDLCKWNGWTNAPILQIGQTVAVQQ